jgi:hypothetical protein
MHQVSAAIARHPRDSRHGRGGDRDPESRCDPPGPCVRVRVYIQPKIALCRRFYARKW